MARSEMHTLLQSVETLQEYDFKDPKERRQVMTTLRKVSDGLQTPLERIMENWGCSARDAALKVCIDLDLFNKWRKAGKTQSANQLAELSGTEPLLMATLLRHLASFNQINEEGPDLYSQTNWSLALCEQAYQEAIKLAFDTHFIAFPSLPTYLKILGYTRTKDSNWTALAYACNYHGHFFEYLATHPSIRQGLDMSMKAFSNSGDNWLDVFPAQNIIEGALPDQPLFVDVGGSIGHDTAKFAHAIPSVSLDRLFLQDKADVLEKATDLPSSITKVPHDFFKSQPILGARAYFFHQVLHNWVDKDAIMILNQIKPVMKRRSEPGYSRVLICDMVMPSIGASVKNTTMDLVMMTTTAALTRNEKQWRGLVEQAGLKIERIWTSEKAEDSVIECVLE